MVSHSLLAGTVFTNTDGCHPPAWRVKGRTWDVTVCPKAHTLQPGLQTPSVPPSQLLSDDSDRSAEQRTGVHWEIAWGLEWVEGLLSQVTNWSLDWLFLLPQKPLQNDFPPSVVFVSFSISEWVYSHILWGFFI